MSKETALTQSDLWQTFRWHEKKVASAKKARRPARQKLKGLFLFCLASCISSWAFSASAQQFTIESAKTELVNNVYILNASLKYSFNKEALQALDNGVSLILIIDIEVIKPRRYVWDEDIATLEQRYELQYLALSDQYLIANKNSGSQNVYQTLNEALVSLEAINNLPIIDAHLLNPDERYKVQVRSRLDLESLPVPLRLSSYFSADWWHNSGWYAWDLLQ